MNYAPWNKWEFWDSICRTWRGLRPVFEETGRIFFNAMKLHMRACCVCTLPWCPSSPLLTNVQGKHCHKSRCAELLLKMWLKSRTMPVFFNWRWEDGKNLTIQIPCDISMTAGIWTSSHLGLLSQSPFLSSNPLIKLWNRFGQHHVSMLSGNKRGSIISWRAGVRGCISPHAGVVLCQETSRFASTCHLSLHGSPEGNLIQTQRPREKDCSKRATNITNLFKISTDLTEHQRSVTWI